MSPRLGVTLILWLACVAGSGLTVFAQTPLATDPYKPLTVGEKAAVFGKRIVSPVGFAKSAFTAGVNQYQDSPEEWGQGLAGYGRRYGHKLANRANENVIGFLIAAPLKQDPRYFRSGVTGFGGRLRHAVVSTFLVRRDDGGRTLAVWRFAGNYGASFISNAWRPERYTGFPDSMLRGTQSLGYDAASNVFKEFWPDIRRKVFKR